MARIQLPILAVGLAIALVGCESNPKSGTVEASFREFKAAVAAAEADRLWRLADRETREAYRTRLEALQELEQRLENQFSEDLRGRLRSRSALDLLDGTSSPAGLFVRTVDLEALNSNRDAIREGLSIRRIETRSESDAGDPGAKSARVLTEAGEAFWFSRDPEGGWKIDLIETADLGDRLEELDRHIERLEAVISKLRDLEPRKREKLLSELGN